MPHPNDGKPKLSAPLQTSALPLAHVEVLEAHGRDAATFLQAQAMNDVAALADGGWQWNGCLSAKGRVLALFALLRIAADRFWLVLPDVPADALAATLRRYLFRSKLQLQPLPMEASALSGHAPFAAPAQAQADGAGWVLDVGSTAHPRHLRLRPAGDAGVGPAAGIAEDAAEAALAWRRLDLRFGLPRLGAAQLDQFTPQMLSLQRLQAFSLTKGCYPGQEIVARTHYLGQARRSLHLFTIDGSCSAGDPVTAAGATVGQVVSVAADGTRSLVLAVCAESSDQPLAIDATPAAPLPLLEGLGRDARAR